MKNMAFVGPWVIALAAGLVSSAGAQIVAAPRVAVKRPTPVPPKPRVQPTATVAPKAQVTPAALAPVLPISRNCLAALGALSTSSPQVGAIDGKTLKDTSDIKALRAKAKDGNTLFIQGGDFSGQKFGSDNFSNICFIGTKLQRTRWSKTRAQGIGFVGSDLTGSVFDRVWLDYALFRNATLVNVDASGTQLAYGQLDGGWEPSIANLKLDGARMMGFRFVCGVTSVDGCPFDRKQISLRGANLAGASISSFSIWDAKLDDVILDNTEIALDQITQFASADVKGAIVVRAEKRRVTLAPASFRAAANILRSTNAADSECNAAEDPLTQIFCQAGQSALRAYRDDVNRLYESTLPAQQAAATVTSSGSISVTAPSKVHARYQKALRRCILKEDDMAISCVATIMSKRRAMLVEELVRTRPLEADGKALYVSAQTPMIQAVANDIRLAGLSPLLVDSSPNVLMAYRDDQQVIQAKGYGKSADGQQCLASFAVPVVTKKTSSRNKRLAVGSTFTAWTSGAEFSLGQPAPTKTKKKRKFKKGEVAPAEVPVATGCASVVQSGPLVRLPISEDDFDRLWINRQVRS